MSDLLSQLQAKIASVKGARSRHEAAIVAEESAKDEVKASLAAVQDAEEAFHQFVDGLWDAPGSGQSEPAS